MAFIQTIPPSEAHGPVREMYQQVERRFGYVPNWAQAFSLRPGARWLGRSPDVHPVPSPRSDLRAGDAGRGPRASKLVLLLGKLLDALGVQADATFNALDPTLREALTVGRPVADRAD